MGRNTNEDSTPDARQVGDGNNTARAGAQSGAKILLNSSPYRSSGKLKNTNIYINEDLCESLVTARKIQLSELKKARADGKIAYISHTKLVIRERGERTAHTQAVSTSPAASVMTVTPATTFAGGAASVGAVTGTGAVVVGEASAGVEDSQRGEGQEVAAQ
ncbi:hypothetical protein Pmani_020330 [Petrolisthes manimaculis]|uniref:Uncharacterized protein n=1 Tax=Petrolisthes manimaculis TaxID=1843537 RepID=A0AAE1U2P4_9EUCA|nr:hypothetical protein Pmani_020330 [Petrolisthes manimaculis]